MKKRHLTHTSLYSTFLPALALAFFLWIQAAHAGPTHCYTTEIIPAPADPNQFYGLSSLSDTNVAAGTILDMTDISFHQGFIYQNGAITNIGNNTYVAAANNSAQATGGDFNVNTAFYWDQNDGFTYFNGLEGTAINNQKHIAAVKPNPNCHASFCPLVPVLWTRESGSVDLPLLHQCADADEVGEANSINDDDISVGVAGKLFHFQGRDECVAQAVRWSNGAIEQLPGLGDNISSTATAINNHGLIIGQSQLRVNDFAHGVIWRDGQIIDLQSQLGLEYLTLSAVSNNNVVVGLYQPAPLYNSVAIAYDSVSGETWDFSAYILDSQWDSVPSMIPHGITTGGAILVSGSLNNQPQYAILHPADCQ